MVTAGQIHPISFDSFAAMAAHLDRWAANALTNFGPRSQALLMSYEINCRVAGAETWRLVPSSEPGRPGDEHGYPVRVPITTSAVEPDPFVGASRPARAIVERWE
jgi:hypothetical protein